MRSSTGWVFVLGVIAGCGDQIVEPDPLDEAAAFAQGRLEALEVLRRAPDGVPGIVSGDLGVAVDPTSELDVRAAIAPYLPAYRVRDADLVLQRVFVAENDDRLYRFTQLDDGVEVVGGLVVAHVDAGGRVFALSTKARGPDSLAGAARPRLDPDAIARLPGTPVIGVRFIYYITEDAVRRPAYEVRRAGTGLGEEVEYLDADDGTLLARNDGFRAANRSIYRYLGSGLLPGQARRAEGAPADTVAAVNMAYEHTGTTRSAYTKFWNRPDIGIANPLTVATVLTNLPAVHPNSNDSCGAWWKGSPAGLEQIVLGFADSPPGQTSCLSADNALDVVAHEYTHGVTQAEGGLNSGGEAGGLDESIADIFGALVQAWADVSPTQTGTELRLRADTWTFAEDMYASGYWRSMCNPREHDPVNDKDYYDADFNDLLPNGDELYGSHQKATLTDLMFCLLSRGGPHPRPASGSTVSSIGIGMDRAIKIVYIARNALAQNADLADFRAEMEIAGNSLYGTTGTYAVQCAFAAIGIGAPPFSVSCQRDDVLFTNTTTGSIYSWQMNGMTAINTYTYGTLPAGYEVKGTGDFDNDAKTDLLLHNASTGASQLWLTRGASSPVVVPSSLPGTGWEFQTIGDFDGGGIADVLWKNTSTGALNVWQMNAGFLFPVVTGGTLTTETVAATADFNLDDRDDVVLTRTDGSGNLQVKIARAQDVATVGLQTPAQAITLNPTTPLSAADYRVIAAGDLSGDGVPDLVFQNGTSGNVKVWLMNSAANYTIASETSVATSLLTTAFGGVGYIDGDAKADLVWRLAPPSSKLKVWFMDGATITTSYTYTGNPSVPGTKLGIGQFN